MQVVHLVSNASSCLLEALLFLPLGHAGMEGIFCQPVYNDGRLCWVGFVLDRAISSRPFLPFACGKQVRALDACGRMERVMRSGPSIPPNPSSLLFSDWRCVASSMQATEILADLFVSLLRPSSLCTPARAAAVFVSRGMVMVGPGCHHVMSGSWIHPSHG